MHRIVLSCNNVDNSFINGINKENIVIRIEDIYPADPVSKHTHVTNSKVRSRIEGWIGEIDNLSEVESSIGLDMSAYKQVRRPKISCREV